MNILVTGGNGQLGSELKKCADREKEMTFFFYDLPELDITDSENVRRVCRGHEITAIVNCAAYTAVDKAEENEEAAYRGNRDGPAVLAEVAKEHNALLLHVSTDYVFNGESCVPYREDDQPSPLGVYGRSKWEGEEQIRRTAPSYMIVRTSWLYSPCGRNFVKTMLRLGRERELLEVVFDQVGCPTSAADLAGALVSILARYDRTHTYAETYHYSNEGVCSWYDFALAIMRTKGIECKVLPVGSEEYPTKAKRPHYSVLHKGKIKEHWGLQIPHWQDSLEKMLGRLD